MIDILQYYADWLKTLLRQDPVAVQYHCWIHHYILLQTICMSVICMCMLYVCKVCTTFLYMYVYMSSLYYPNKPIVLDICLVLSLTHHQSDLGYHKILSTNQATYMQISIIVYNQEFIIDKLLIQQNETILTANNCRLQDKLHQYSGTVVFFIIIGRIIILFDKSTPHANNCRL